MKNNIDIETLVIDSNNLRSSISALSEMSYSRIQLNSITLEYINELNGIIASIQCLADKHAKDMENYEYEVA